MRDWLQINWSIHATVVHDKPPHFFQGATVEQQHELLQRVGDQLTHCNDVRCVFGYTVVLYTY